MIFDLSLFGYSLPYRQLENIFLLSSTNGLIVRSAHCVDTERATSSAAAFHRNTGKLLVGGGDKISE